MSRGVHIVHGFHSGNRTVKGQPNPDLRHFDTVTIILPSAIDRVLGTRTRAERLALLRKLRDRGTLIAPLKGERLQHVVRGDDGVRFRAYVFAVQHPDYVAVAVDKIRHPAYYRR